MPTVNSPPPRYCLGDHARVVAGRQLEGGAQAARLLDLADADAGALVGRLDEQRQAKARLDGGEVAGGVEHHVIRHRQARVACQTSLERHLSIARADASTPLPV
jgi:hypothetical protein